MSERGSTGLPCACSGFLFEAGAPVGVGRELLWKDLDSHLTPEPRILGPIDLTHAAGGERRDDLIGPKAGPGGECHP